MHRYLTVSSPTLCPDFNVVVVGFDHLEIGNDTFEDEDLIPSFHVA